jgi:hypothetical protein
MKVFLIFIYVAIFGGLIVFAIIRGSALKPEPWSTPAKNGRTAEIKRMVEAGLSPNSEDRDGETPLSLAMKNGQLGTSKYLLSVGADPNHVNKQGQSILQVVETTAEDPNVALWFRDQMKKLSTPAR